MIGYKLKNLLFKEFVWRRPFEIESVFDLLIHLASLSPRATLVWEARGHGGFVRYILGADYKHWSKIEEAMKSHGNIQFYNLHKRDRLPVGEARHLKFTSQCLALNTNVTMAVIRAGLAAMAAVREGEESVLQIILGSSYAPSTIPAKMLDPTASWMHRALAGVGQASPESRSSAKEKASQHGFHAAIRIGVTGRNNTGRLASIHGAIKTLESAGVRIHAYPEKPLRLNNAHAPFFYPLRISVKELASFLLLPAGEEVLDGAEGLHPKPMLPPSWLKEPTGPSTDRTFAMSINKQNPQKLSLSLHDSLEHCHIIGPNGSGKSTVMLHLILANIRAGGSVLVIDPKSDLVNAVLERIPEERADDVVVLDPSDPAPVGFNPFAFKRYKNKELIADAVLAVLKEIFSENWGILTQDVLSVALLTLAEVDGASLMWLPALLTDATFRQKITAQVKDKTGLRRFWEHFETMGGREQTQMIAPVMNKMRQFELRSGLRNVLGQSNPKFNLTDLFNKRRIVLVPLNKGLIGADSARLLGSLIIGLSWTLALSRASLPPEKRHVVGVFVDELQDYIALPTDLSDALAQARGLGMALTLAHQYREQLPPQVRAGVDANARNKIVFGLNAADAKDMAAMAPELTALDFMTLPRYQIYTSFHQNGRNTGWIQGQTRPMPPTSATAAELKARSMMRYGRPAYEVDDELHRITAAEDTPDESPEIIDTQKPGRREKR